MCYSQTLPFEYSSGFKVQVTRKRKCFLKYWRRWPLLQGIVLCTFSQSLSQWHGTHTLTTTGNGISVSYIMSSNVLDWWYEFHLEYVYHFLSYELSNVFVARKYRFFNVLSLQVVQLSSHSTPTSLPLPPSPSQS